MSEDSGGLSNSNEDEPPDEIGENLPASINGDDEELQEVIGENLPAIINGDDEELQEVIGENLPASINGDNEELQEVIGENLPESINGDDEELQEEIGENLLAIINGDDEEQHLVEDETQQGQRLRIVSPRSPPRCYCCCSLITEVVLGITLLVYLSVREKKPAIVSPEAGNVTCPRDWIVFGHKCFYLSENTSNWTFSQTSCMELEANLTQIDSLEELDFLNRTYGHSAAWIGLHRESSEQPWMWIDNTEYNNLTLIRGVGNHAYLSDRGISSSKDYIPRRWICSKPKAIL